MTNDVSMMVRSLPKSFCVPVTLRDIDRVDRLLHEGEAFVAHGLTTPVTNGLL